MTASRPNFPGMPQPEQPRTLILASSSPRRRELIQMLGLPVRLRACDVDESVEPGTKPAAMVEELAERKAAASQEAAESGEDGIVIGSDTIVVVDDRILGKPRDREEAARMLRGLQGRAHEVYTGVACIDLRTKVVLVRHRVTRVWMKPLTERQLDGYVATGEPDDKAGAYAVQGLGATLVERIEGDYFNVVGLPVSLLSDMLGELGVEVLGSRY